MDKADKIRATRDQQIERQRTSKLVHALPSPFELAVVGVSFTPHYPQNLYALEEAWLQAELTDEKLPVIIIRNPDNAYDANACEVHVPALGEQGMVGHITKALAARLAPTIDAGVTWQGYVSHLKINEAHPDRPGLEIKLEQIT